MDTTLPTSPVPTYKTNDTHPDHKSRRISAILRPFLFLTHFLHAVSSIIVLILAIILANHYKKDGAFQKRFRGHATYFATLAGIDFLIMLPIMIISIRGHAKVQHAISTLVLAILFGTWFAAFAFAVTDFLTGKYGSCKETKVTMFNRPTSYFKCTEKHTLIDFAMVALITSFIGAIPHLFLCTMNRAKHNGQPGDLEKPMPDRSEISPTAFAS